MLFKEISGIFGKKEAFRQVDWLITEIVNFDPIRADSVAVDEVTGQQSASFQACWLEFQRFAFAEGYHFLMASIALRFTVLLKIHCESFNRQQGRVMYRELNTQCCGPLNVLLRRCSDFVLVEPVPINFSRSNVRCLLH